jgi:hypothetical protein
VLLVDELEEFRIRMASTRPSVSTDVPVVFAMISLIGFVG